MKSDYIPQKQDLQDLIWIDFNPSVGKEIQKRRPAVVISSRAYSQQTGFVAVCPITHGQKKLRERGLLVPVRSSKIDGWVNPFQLHTFDFRERSADFISQMPTADFQKVVQLYSYIFED